MDAARRILKVLAICCLCNMAPHALPADPVSGPDAGAVPAVTIELTKLEVTDSSLELGYKIRNNSNHEAWVCSEVGRIPFESFLTRDRQTLLIRKHLSVPCYKIWHRPPEPGKYVRLSAGAAQSESLRIGLPAAGQFMYTSETTEVITQTVRRLILEIGYYNEDLFALARNICAVADQFSAEGWKLYMTTSGVDPNMWHTYFREITARGALADFEMMNKDPAGRGYVYLNYSYEALAEKILRLDINGVAIPYNGRIEMEVPRDSR